MKHHFLLFFLLSSLGHAQAPAVSSAPNWNDAAWIGYTADGRDVQFSERSSQYLENKPVQRRTYVSPLLRTEFRVDQEVRSAKAWVCGLGLYELYFNGERIGD